MKIHPIISLAHINSPKHSVNNDQNTSEKYISFSIMPVEYGINSFSEYIE